MKKEIPGPFGPIVTEMLGMELSGLTKVVTIFSHGFGVRMQGREGLLLAIAERITRNSGTAAVLFDYTTPYPEPDSMDRLSPSLSEQGQMFAAVYRFVQENAPHALINVVGHSLGNFPPAVIDIDQRYHKAVVLAPPINAGFYRHFLKRFGEREGSVIDLEAVSRIKRSDLSTTVILPQFWTDLHDLLPRRLIAKLVGCSSGVMLVRGIDDQVIGGNGPSDYLELVAAMRGRLDLVNIAGGHDFEGNAEYLAQQVGWFLGL